MALCLWAARCPAQELTAAGDPLLTVRDAGQAAPVETRGAKIRPLAAGETVRLEEETGGLAVVVVEEKQTSPTSERRFRLPRTALAGAPGKTWPTPPAWLPAPAPAGTEARDVIAYEDGASLMVLEGSGKPRRLAKGSSPAVSPDGALLAYSPADAPGAVDVMALAAPGKPRRIGGGGLPVLEKFFSPDGKRLFWRRADRIEVVDLASPQAPVTVIASGLPSDRALQGPTRDGAALILQDLEHVTWLGLDGRVARQEPIGTFTDDPWGSSADAYRPSPADDALLLVGRDVAPSRAYARWADGPSAALYLYDAASGTNYRLTPRNLAAVYPAWSPDGRRMYFSGLPEKPANGRHHLYRVNADGTGLTDLGKGWLPSVGTR